MLLIEAGYLVPKSARFICVRTNFTVTAKISFVYVQLSTVGEILNDTAVTVKLLRFGQK